jgi:hypothetical protein
MAQKYTDKELADWFVGKARTAAGYRKNILANDSRSKDDTVIGKMFFFKYDPKWKNILPVYDKFPMVFPIESYSDGFLGLNLHYLNPQQRIYLITILSGFASNKRLTPTTRLKLSYDVLQTTKTLFGLSKPCIKRYLYNHVRSKFIEIQPDEWEKAAALPVEMFVTKK